MRTRIAFPDTFATFATLLIATGCNVFEPPPHSEKTSLVHAPGRDGAGGNAIDESGGSGGTIMSSKDAGMSSGGSAQTDSGGSGSGSAVGNGGGATEMDGASPGGKSGGPTEPWWPTKRTVTVDNVEVTCKSAGIPKPEDRVASDPGESTPPIYLAVERFRIGAVDEVADPMHPGALMLVPNLDAWKGLGFDIDGACTRSSTCGYLDDLADQRACTNAQTIPFDGNDCLDNSMGSIFKIGATDPSVGKWFGLTEQDWNCEMWRGGMSNIFKVSNYNGEYNDDSVKVDLYTTIGLKKFPEWSCRETIDAPLATDWYLHARWTTSAHWIITRDSISPSADTPPDNDIPDSQWEDPAAYVRGGWLIVHLPDASLLWLNGQRTPVPGFRQIMHRNVTAVRLVHDAQSGLWSMQDGITSYVSRPSEVLDSFAGLGFCENMCGTFQGMKDYLNTYQDAISNDSNAPPETQCDALSYGMTFRASQITADAGDIQDADPFTPCPEPRHPEAPRQGCKCSTDGSTCTVDDGGS